MDNTTSNSVAGTLHPLIPTTEPRPGDTSMDTSVDHICHGFDEDMATERIYGIPGINTQGPSGTRVPDWRAPREYLDRELSEELKFGYVDAQGEAPQDSAGPVDPLDIQMADYASSGGMQEASDAVMRARRAGKGGLALLDELEQAEQAYERQHSPPAPAPSAAAAAGATASEGAGATRAGHAIGDDVRRRVVDKLAASLQENGGFAAGRSREELAEAARACEQALFTSSHSKVVYMSKASNAIRVAKSVAEVSDLPRIASGEPKAAPGAVDTSPYATGLQGYVLKPDYT